MSDICEECGVFGALVVHSLTCYYWDGKGEDPNRDLILCEECKKRYVEYWKEMWETYYNSCP